MKEMFSAFGSEVLRPLVTLVAPGAFAAVPWLVVILMRYEKPVKIFESYRTESSFAVLFGCLLLGLLVDALGALVETSVLDKRLPRRAGFERHNEEWFEYLRLAFPVEPVGHRYLRILVLHLKFELDGAVGLLCGVLAYVWLPASVSVRVMAVVLTGALSGYLFYEGKNSHCALSKLRRELLKGINVIGQSVISQR